MICQCDSSIVTTISLVRELIVGEVVHVSVLFAQFCSKPKTDLQTKAYYFSKWHWIKKSYTSGNHSKQWSKIILQVTASLVWHKQLPFSYAAKVTVYRIVKCKVYSQDNHSYSYKFHLETIFSLCLSSSCKSSFFLTYDLRIMWFLHRQQTSRGI